MTKEELAEIINLMNKSKQQVHQTLNFNAPIGQQIAHVDKIEAHFDKDMGMQIANADAINTQKQTIIGEECVSPKPLSKDECIKNALDFIIEDGAIVNKYDYAMIQMVLEQELNIHFDNGKSFVDYLNVIGITYLEPTADAINKIVSNTKGQYPNWSWQNADHTEELRRNNIAKRFMSAYNKQAK